MRGYRSLMPSVPALTGGLAFNPTWQQLPNCRCDGCLRDRGEIPGVPTPLHPGVPMFRRFGALRKGLVDW